MSVVMEYTIAPKYVQTLMEASLVNVMMAMNWILMELLVMVCIYSIYIQTPYILQGKDQNK